MKSLITFLYHLFNSSNMSTTLASPNITISTTAKGKFIGKEARYDFKPGQIYTVNIQASPFCVGVWGSDTRYVGYRNVEAFKAEWDCSMRDQFEGAIGSLKVIDRIQSSR